MINTEERVNLEMPGDERPLSLPSNLLGISQLVGESETTSKSTVGAVYKGSYEINGGVRPVAIKVFPFLSQDELDSYYSNYHEIWGPHYVHRPDELSEHIRGLLEQDKLIPERDFKHEYPRAKFLSEIGIGPKVYGYANLNGEYLYLMDWIEGSANTIPPEWVDKETLAQFDKVYEILGTYGLIFDDPQYIITPEKKLVFIDAEGLVKISEDPDDLATYEEVRKRARQGLEDAFNSKEEKKSASNKRRFWNLFSRL